MLVISSGNASMKENYPGYWCDRKSTNNNRVVIVHRPEKLKCEL